MKTTKSASSMQQLKKYYDKLGRVVTVLKDKVTKQYRVEAKHFDAYSQSVVFFAYSFPNRTACFKALHDKFPREIEHKILRNKMPLNA